MKIAVQVVVLVRDRPDGMYGTSNCMIHVIVQSTVSGKVGHLGLLALPLVDKENGITLDPVCLPSVEVLVTATEVR